MIEYEENIELKNIEKYMLKSLSEDIKEKVQTRQLLTKLENNE